MRVSGTQHEDHKVDARTILRNVDRAAAGIPAWATPYLERALRIARESMRARPDGEARGERS